MELKGIERSTFEDNGKGERLCVCVGAHAYVHVRKGKREGGKKKGKERGFEFQETAEKEKHRKAPRLGDRHSLRGAQSGGKALRSLHGVSYSAEPQARGLASTEILCSTCDK